MPRPGFRYTRRRGLQQVLVDSLRDVPCQLGREVAGCVAAASRAISLLTRELGVVQRSPALRTESARPPDPALSGALTVDVKRMRWSGRDSLVRAVLRSQRVRGG